MNKPILILAVISALFLIGDTTFSDPFKGPWKTEKKSSVKREKKGSNPLQFLVKIYRDSISPIDGSRCPMYPTCSQYSVSCFEKHGFLLGWIMTCDRLIHEADEMILAPRIMVHNRYRSYDPVENNDFWWYNEK